MLQSKAITAFVLALAANRAHAQCADFKPGFGASGVAGGELANHVNAQVEFDDGSGPALYVGGLFDVAGEVQAENVARWDGAHWSALTFPSGQGFLPDPSAEVRALANFDDGSGTGPCLFVGGNFASVDGIATTWAAKYDGQTWYAMPGLSSVSPNGASVRDFAVFDDGTGAALYAGGVFDHANAALAQGVAKWTGMAWIPVGNGSGAGSFVEALEVFDDGSGAGESLYIGGWFGPSGSSAVGNCVVRWDGASYSALGTGLSWLFPQQDDVRAMVGFDDGSGPALYVGGFITLAGGHPVTNICKWNGVTATWSAVGSLPQKFVQDLVPFDDGGGPALFAATVGTGSSATGASSIYRLDNGAWTDVSGNGPSTYDLGFDLCVWNDGAGDGLYLGGDFEVVGFDRADSIARWSNGALHPVSASPGRMGRVDALATDGSGVLYADNGAYDGVHSFGEGVEHWDGASWTPLYPYLDGDVLALHVHQGSLYAAGTFLTAGSAGTVNGVARWDGTTWQALGSGLHDLPPVGHDLETFDFGAGPVLVVAGVFTSAGSDTNAKRIAVWDGANWSALATGFSHAVRALATFDDGGGAKLYAAGNFVLAGSTSAIRVARWDGSAWQPLGSGIDGIVLDMAVHDDGSGPALYMCGHFTTAGGQPALRLARWSGSAWVPMPVVGANAEVDALASYDDGSGSKLYAGGKFTQIGGVGAAYLARWDGAAWSALGGGTNDFVWELAALDRPAGADSLFIGGDFTHAGDVAAMRIAEFTFARPCPPVSYCTPGTTSNGCNAHIVGTGTPSASASSGFVLDVLNVEGDKPGVIFYGINGRHAAPWGMGSSSFLCVKAPTQRSGFQFPGGTPGLCDGVLTLDWNNWVFTHPGTLGAPFAVGQVVDAQGWFRDPPAPKTTSLSDALEF